MSSEMAMSFLLSALTLVADATVVLLVAWVAILTTRKRSSLRHAVWVAAFAALLLLPLVSYVHRGTRTVPIEMPAMHSASTAPLSSGLAPAPNVAPAPNSGPASVLLSPARPVPARQNDWPAAARLLLGVWLAGSAALFVWIGIAGQGLRSLCRSSVPSKWREGEFERLSLHFKLRRPVTLRVSRPGLQISAMTWGVRRPVILLPADAATWSDTERESILLHELAHVHRCDSLYQFLAALVTSLFWFHPAVWLASWAMRSEAEMAADDAVVRAGVRASDYASHLVALASKCRSHRRPRLSLGVFMMKRSGIERRVRSIVDPDRRRRGTSTTQVASIVVAALLVVFFVTSVRPIINTGSEVSDHLFDQALLQATQHERNPVMHRIAMEKELEWERNWEHEKSAQRRSRAGLPVEVVANQFEPRGVRRQPHRSPYVAVQVKARTLPAQPAVRVAKRTVTTRPAIRVARRAITTQPPLRVAKRNAPDSVLSQAPEALVAFRAPAVTQVSEARAIPLVVHAPLALPAPRHAVVPRAVVPATFSMVPSEPTSIEPGQNGDSAEAVRPFHAVVVDSEVQLTLQVGHSKGFSVCCPGAGPDESTTGGAAETFTRGKDQETVLTATVVDGVLHLHGAQRVDVIATTPNLDGLQVTGNSAVRCTGISTQAFALTASGNSAVELHGHAGRFELILSGSSALRGLNLCAQHLQAGISGSSSMELGGNFTSLTLDADGGSSLAAHGHVYRLDVTGNGGSSVDCSSLSAQEVEADAAGGVGMRVCAAKSMTAHAKGSSKIQYSGNPKLVNSTADDSSQVYF
jgi:beta-lactamase regulating signal transducer with metallopeptidase domain